jgi:hypothetical protein
MWSMLVISIQTREKFKGLLKLNLRMQLSLDNTSVRTDEDPFGVLKDPSDEKCLVKLVIHLANMTHENASCVFCYLGKSKSFIKEMHEAGTPHIKVDWRKYIGQNPMGKAIKYLTNKTGVPMPTKGQMGAHGIRHRALTGLKKHDVFDFETKLDFRHESDEANLMYPESKLRMREQKYAAQMLNGKTVLATMLARNGTKDDSDDQEIAFKVHNAPKKIVALPGTMLAKLLAASSGKKKTDELVADFIQPLSIDEINKEKVTATSEVPIRVPPPVKSVSHQHTRQLHKPPPPPLPPLPDLPPLHVSTHIVTVKSPQLPEATTGRPM